MCKSEITTQPSLEELYTTDELVLLRRTITKLTNKQDYNTLITLFRLSPNAEQFDTRTLNEDIHQETKQFTKCNGTFCKVARTVP